MQANKATPEIKKELEIWLQNPRLGSGKISQAAMDDLDLLQNSKDLSSVSIDPEKHPLRARSSESFSKGSTLGKGGNNSAAGGGGGGGGLLAFFGCASKRK